MKFAGAMLVVAMCSCSRTPEATDAPATRVKIERVETSVQTYGKSYSGTVVESSGTMLSFSAAGTIRQMYVGVGDRVAKGQLIATLDPSNLRHAYERLIPATCVGAINVVGPVLGGTGRL